MHPGLWEVRQVYSPVALKPIDAAAGSFQLINRYEFTDLRGTVMLSWNLAVDGVTVKSGQQAVPAVAPHTSVNIVIEGVQSTAVKLRNSRRLAETHLTVYMTLVNADEFRNAGHVLSIWQGDLSALSAVERARLSGTIANSAAAQASARSAQHQSPVQQEEEPSLMRKLLTCCLPEDNILVAKPGHKEQHQSAQPVEMHQVRQQQPQGTPKASMKALVPPITLTVSGDILSLQGGGSEGVAVFEYLFSQSAGYFADLAFNGQIAAMAGPAPNLWRPTTDNDKGGAFASFAAMWKRAGYDTTKLSDVLAVWSQSADMTSVTIDVQGVLPITNPVGNFNYTAKYIVWGDGKIDFQSNYKFAPNDAAEEIVPLPRVGVIFQVPTDVEQLTWYGQGPHENYPDRQVSSPVGIYTADLDALHTDYIKPQENGSRGGVRWVALESFSPANHGLVLTAAPGTSVHTSISRYTMDNLLTARHTKDLVPAANLEWFCAFFPLSQSFIALMKIIKFQESRLRPGRPRRRQLVVAPDAHGLPTPRHRVLARVHAPALHRIVQHVIHRGHP